MASRIPCGGRLAGRFVDFPPDFRPRPRHGSPQTSPGRPQTAANDHLHTRRSRGCSLRRTNHPVRHAGVAVRHRQDGTAGPRRAAPGCPLADRLCTRMMERYGLPQPLRPDLQVKRYADDLTLRHPETQLTEQAQHAALDSRGHTVLVVDAVWYTGHLLLKVVDSLARKQPAAIRACLVDRVTARLPLHADVVGVRLGVAPPDIIECHVPPYGPDFRMEPMQPDRQR